MRIAITTVQVPFIRGGAELLAEELARALREAGHQAEIVSLPFKWYPAHCLVDVMAAWRLMDLTSSNGQEIDHVIALKFPAYLADHPRQSVWLLHQHREAFDLWDSQFNSLRPDPQGAEVRELIAAADRHYLKAARGCYTISRNVSRRLRESCGVSSLPLYHPPPGASDLRRGEYGDYLLMPSRINQTKRQALVLAALHLTRSDVRVVFMGESDHADYGLSLRAEAASLGDRVEWRGRVPTADRIQLYADARAVIFPPVDEDYGYVTLEAMLAAKPVLTCTDSGGVLEFVVDGDNGLVCEPDAEMLADALDQLWQRPGQARQMGERGAERYVELDIGWDNVLPHLLA